MSYEQRSYPGAAADTLLAAGITNSGLSFTVTAGTGSGYPDGSGGKFWVILDWDASTAEKVLVTSRVGDVFTITSGDRGLDGTSASAHDSGAKVRACWTATDAQEANRAVVNTVGRVTAKGDLLVGSGANTLARQGVGTDGQVLTARSSATNGVQFETLTKTVRLPHTWAIPGSVAVASGDTDYIIPFFIPVPATQTVTVVGARYRINSGTSATVKLQKNDVDVAGFTGISVTTTSATTSGSVALADGDKLALVVTAVSGSPKNMTFSVDLDYAV